MHADIGPLLLGLWYRPPCYGEVQSIIDFEVELKTWVVATVGTIVFGDMNVHHKAWLKYSSKTKPEGSMLFKVCARQALLQLVQRPTRDKYLLDLVLSDLGQLMKVKVLSNKLATIIWFNLK